MKIAIGADHRGFLKKQLLMTAFNNREYQLIDMGTYASERTDYPIFARKVMHEIINGDAQLGILLCGSGIGMAIVANRYQTTYAGVVWNETVAKAAKEDDNVNVLVLPCDYIDDNQVLPIVNAWLQASFKKDRYAERLAMIDAWRDID